MFLKKATTREKKRKKWECVYLQILSPWRLQDLRLGEMHFTISHRAKTINISLD